MTPNCPASSWNLDPLSPSAPGQANHTQPNGLTAGSHARRQVVWQPSGSGDRWQLTIWEDPVTHTIAWDKVTHADVVRAIQEYDELGSERFFSKHGFAPTTTYEMIWDGRSYPPKAILGTAYEFATGERLASGDFEGGKSGAVRVLTKLGFTIEAIRRSAE